MFSYTMATMLRVAAPVAVPQKAALRMSSTVRPTAAVVRAGESNGMRSAFLGGFASAFTGFTVGVGAVRESMGRGLGLMVEANAKKGMQGNLQGATNKARARTSGFRTRMASPNGRNVLKARRAKGRKDLVPASIKPHK